MLASVSFTDLHLSSKCDKKYFHINQGDKNCKIKMQDIDLMTFGKYPSFLWWSRLSFPVSRNVQTVHEHNDLWPQWPSLTWSWGRDKESCCSLSRPDVWRSIWAGSASSAGPGYSPIWSGSRWRPPVVNSGTGFNTKTSDEAFFYIRRHIYQASQQGNHYKLHTNAQSDALLVLLLRTKSKSILLDY